jgi:hypothetical protein
MRGKGREIDERLERASKHDWYIRKQIKQAIQDESQRGRPFSYDGVGAEPLIFLLEVSGELYRAGRIWKAVYVQVFVVEIEAGGVLLVHRRFQAPREQHDARCIGVVRVDHQNSLRLLRRLRVSRHGGGRDHDGDKDRTEYATHAREQLVLVERLAQAVRHCVRVLEHSHRKLRVRRHENDRRRPALRFQPFLELVPVQPRPQMDVEQRARGLRAVRAPEEFLGGAEPARKDADAPEQANQGRTKRFIVVDDRHPPLLTHHDLEVSSPPPCHPFADHSPPHSP